MTDEHLADVAVETFRRLRREERANLPGVWTVEIAGVLPCLNETQRGATEGGRAARRAERARWGRDAYYALKAAGVPALGRARVTLTRIAPATRRPDPDNVAGGAGKQIVDALKLAGVVPDDDAAHLEVSYHAEYDRDPRRARVVLQIEALP